MLPLNPLTLPLPTINLIEASAGTGKTHTIASLYLRLLLQVGENAFPEALTVDQILVVTFTKMATEELKGRIRERIYQAKLALQDYLQHQDLNQVEDAYLKELIPLIPNLDIAITRLTLAEQDFDLASIFTIHSFCQRMLKRYAFNSGMPFEINLIDETLEKSLKERFANEVWRENFYSQPLLVAKFIMDKLKTPQTLLKNVGNFIGKKLALKEENVFVHLSVSELLEQQIAPTLEKQERLVLAFKEAWLKQSDELWQLYLENGTKLKRNTNNNYQKYFNAVQNWVLDTENYQVPKEIAKYFTQGAVINNTAKKFEPFEHPLLVQAENFLLEIEPLEKKNQLNETLLQYQFLQEVGQKLADYKENNTEKYYDDLLRLMQKALQGEQGKELAHLIRTQYPFAMIDEFQDTDAQQYFIFSQIYLQETEQTTGFLMIGDPKQSIYKFRGADIFSYLNAAKKSTHQYTLNHNWRSKKGLITAINQLFTFPQNENTPNTFLYEDIQYQQVHAAKELADFKLNGQIEPPLRIYTQNSEESSDADLAKTCAKSIREWLESAKKGQATLGDTCVSAENIAVLLRNKTQAELVKQALDEQGINSVYLSERNKVFQSDIARDLLWILSACLNPLSERHVLNALSCSLFGLTLEEIYAIKQQENLWEDYVARFLTYQRLWQQQGVLPMLHELLEKEQLNERQFQCSGGERKLTDYLHLAGLLQQASVLNESESALLHWFEKNVTDENMGADTAEIRLESDRALVKLVTIHKSKGLAYDLVWLPFAHSTVSQRNNDIDTYFDKEEQQVFWDIHHEEKEKILREDLAEEMRLLYVALTRAKYQVVMALPQVLCRKSPQGKDWSALWYALSEGALGISLAKTEQNVQPLIQNWQRKAGQENIQIAESESLTSYPEPFTENKTPSVLKACEFTGNIQKDWTTLSFTKIKYKHLAKQGDTLLETPKNAYFQSDADYDESDLKSENAFNLFESFEIETPLDYPQGLSPFDLSKGEKAGTA